MLPMKLAFVSSEVEVQASKKYCCGTANKNERRGQLTRISSTAVSLVSKLASENEGDGMIA